MKKYEYGQLSKRMGRDGFHWSFFLGDDENSVGSSLDDEMNVLNIIGKEGWEVAFQISYNEKTYERDLMMQREI